MLVIAKTWNQFNCLSWVEWKWFAAYSENVYNCGNANPHNSMNRSLSRNDNGIKPDLKVYILCDAIYINLKIRQNWWKSGWLL